MTVAVFFTKLRRRLCKIIFGYTHSWNKGAFLYSSYWHYLFHRTRHPKSFQVQYYTARPNPRAGIGHQMANWNAGYWWAKQFELHFAHIAFSPKSWDYFLGFGDEEKLYSELISKERYKTVKLPRFDGHNKNEVLLQQSIISSYAGKKIAFLAEQDQSYPEQIGVKDIIQRKFYSAPARKDDQLEYDEDHFNIAIHIRRGDIMTNVKNPNLTMRILSNQYYYQVLKEALKRIHTSKEIHIYLFSQGKSTEFPEFFEFNNVHWCFNMSAPQSFLHMVYADVLITSRSSFSYKPALLNKGLKYCPKDFWHAYPSTSDWILCDEDGHYE